jgi:ABC-type branched-subunit amino acid transport system ATPase component
MFLDLCSRSIAGQRHRSGKTTCIDAITGFTPYRGRVQLAGVSLDGRPPHDRARLGLATTFQSAELFDDLDVLGNLLVAASRPAWWWPLPDLVRPKRSSRGGIGSRGGGRRIARHLPSTRPRHE